MWRSECFFEPHEVLLITMLISTLSTAKKNVCYFKTLLVFVLWTKQLKQCIFPKNIHPSLRRVITKLYQIFKKYLPRWGWYRSSLSNIRCMYPGCCLRSHPIVSSYSRNTSKMKSIKDTFGERQGATKLFTQCTYISLYPWFRQKSGKYLWHYYICLKDTLWQTCGCVENTTQFKPYMALSWASKHAHLWR